MRAVCFAYADVMQVWVLIRYSEHKVVLAVVVLLSYLVSFLVALST